MNIFTRSMRRFTRLPLIPVCLLTEPLMGELGFILAPLYNTCLGYYYTMPGKPRPTEVDRWWGMLRPAVYAACAKPGGVCLPGDLESERTRCSFQRWLLSGQLFRDEHKLGCGMAVPCFLHQCTKTVENQTLGNQENQMRAG